ncbi:MAG: ATP-dependent Clp protease ATP-binding subunit ClpX [Cryomorphaceae bacterium]|jgi:ATP-dependent Clp protease ATP-binding subunit ClpX
MMSDKDNDKTPSKKDSPPSPEEMQETLKDLFSKIGGGGMSFSPFMQEMDKGVPEDDEPEPVETDTLESLDDFNLIPREVKTHLDRFVIRQDEAKKALAIAVCDHYNHAKNVRAMEEAGEEDKLEYQKQNVIVVGPTGVGKTYLVKHIAEMIGVPFVKADATKFSETGYVGGDVDDLVRELVRKADGNVELAEYGIIYIDEVDKLASKGGESFGKDVSGRGVQTTLLKLMEETEVPLSNPMDMKGQMMSMMAMERGAKPKKETINTRHILFIVSGAFSGLEKIVSKRVQSTQIGFQVGERNEVLDSELFRNVETQDFIDFGFEAEFIGRLPVRVVCEKLEKDDFINIMKFSEGSILRQYEREFEAYGIHASFDDSAIASVAELAEKENTGARALMTVLADMLREFKFELPGTSISELKIDSELIDNKEEVLAKYRLEGLKVNIEKVRDEVAIYAREFSMNHGVKMDFTEDAVLALADLSSLQGRNVLQICRSKFKDYQFGLKLIQGNNGRESFEIGKEAIHDADKFLSDMVVHSYDVAKKDEDGGESAADSPSTSD